MDCKKECPFMNIEASLPTHDIEIVLLVESEATSVAFSSTLSKLITNIINSLKLDPNKLYITELYKCDTNGETLTKTKLKKCLPIIKKELNVLKPKYIFSFSRQVTSILLGGTYNYLSPVYSSDYNSVVVPLFGLDIYSENISLYEETLKELINILQNETITKSLPYKILLDEDEILDFIENDLKTKDRLSFDIETTGLDMFNSNTKLLSIAFAYNNTGVAFPVDVSYNGLPLVNREKILNKLEELFSSNDILFIGHNIKFDIKVLNKLAGIKTVNKFFDTMIGGYVLNENSLSNKLEAWLPEINVENHKGYDFNDEEYKRGSFSSMENIQNLLIYNAKDSASTLLLSDYLFANLSEENIDVVVLLTELTRVLIDVELNGIRIDVDSIASIKQALEEEIKDLYSKLLTYPEVYAVAEKLNKKIIEINFNSPQQIAEIFKAGGYPVIEYTANGAVSTGAKVLKILAEEHKIPFATDLYDYRIKTKILNGFIMPYMEGDVVKEDKRIHSTFHLTGTVTGRLSSSSPNLQQLPRGNTVKQLLLPEEGHLMINADYSQMELRVMAALSKDPTLLKAYKEGIDVHAMTASLVYNVPLEEVSKEQRQTAKMVNFAILYGSSAKGLAYRLNRPEKEMEDFITKWYEIYSSVKLFNKQITSFAIANGYVVTPFNRIRHLPDIFSSNGGLKSHAIRQANNFIIQSTASDMTLMSLIQIHKFLTTHPEYDAKILSSVHDSIVLSIRQDQVVELLKIFKTFIESYSYDWMQGITMEAEFSIGTNYANQATIDEISETGIVKALSSLGGEIDEFEPFEDETNF